MTGRGGAYAVTALCLLGVAISGYLTYVHYEDLHPLCLASGGCETVQNSSYSKLAGVPVPLLGVFGYTTILLTLAVPGEFGRAAGAFAALSGFGFSLFLTYLEIFRIKAVCQWCVVSAVLMTALAAILTIRLLGSSGEATNGVEDQNEKERSSA